VVSSQWVAPLIVLLRPPCTYSYQFPYFVSSSSLVLQPRNVPLHQNPKPFTSIPSTTPLGLAPLRVFAPRRFEQPRLNPCSNAPIPCAWHRVSSRSGYPTRQPILYKNSTLSRSFPDHPALSTLRVPHASRPSPSIGCPLASLITDVLAQSYNSCMVCMCVMEYDWKACFRRDGWMARMNGTEMKCPPPLPTLLLSIYYRCRDTEYR